MPTKIWTRDDVEKLVKQWFRDNPARARKEMAISIRAAGKEPSIKDAVATAKHVYRHVTISFGKIYGLGEGEPQIDVIVNWLEDSARKYLRLLGGVDTNGLGYLIADGPHIERTSARTEYERTFPDTMTK